MFAGIGDAVPVCKNVRDAVVDIKLFLKNNFEPLTPYYGVFSDQSELDTARAQLVKISELLKQPW